MRSWYPLAAGAVAATMALVTLVIVLVRAAADDDDAAAAPETATATATNSATPTSVSPATSTAVTSTPATTPTSTPRPATGVLIEHGDRNSRQVALTFDMGGRVDPALDIMNWLVDNEVRSTIFMTGAIVESQNTDAGRKVLALIDAHPDLFDLGNHSYTHPDFRDLTPEQMRDELTRTEAVAGRAARASMRPWFRPPFGGHDADVVRNVAGAGYGYTVMWDIDTIDWRPEADGGPTAPEIVDKVVSRSQGGSIVLMHLGGYNTLEALPAMIAGLRAKGLEPVTLDEMFDH